MEFNGQNRVFVSQADASLAFYESINPSEAKNAPYNLQQITDTNGVHIKAYSQLPLISGVAYGASACNKFNNDTVRKQSLKQEFGAFSIIDQFANQCCNVGTHLLHCH